VIILSKLYFRYGAMNSGKSTALLQVAHNYEERGMSPIIIKPSRDTNGGDKVVSRLGCERTVNISTGVDDDLYDDIKKHMDEVGKVDCVLVDEAQFLQADQVDQLFRFAVIESVPVICYGLRTDFLMNGFEASERLLLIAHSIEELKTICTCGRKALINARKVDGEFVFEGEQIAIDGINHIEYQSLCPKCYFELM
jgi:thymidine kinase